MCDKGDNSCNQKYMYRDKLRCRFMVNSIQGFFLFIFFDNFVKEDLLNGIRVFQQVFFSLVMLFLRIFMYIVASSILD